MNRNIIIIEYLINTFAYSSWDLIALTISPPVIEPIIVGNIYIINNCLDIIDFIYAFDAPNNLIFLYII